MSEKYPWKKCFTLDYSPPVQIFKDFVRVYGNNIELDQLDGAIERSQTEADLLREVKRKWQKEFGKDLGEQTNK